MTYSERASTSPSRVVQAGINMVARYKWGITWLLLAVVFLTIHVAFYASGLLGDENFHAVKIDNILNEKHEATPELPMLPAYHHSVATIMGLFRAPDDLQAMRLVSLSLVFATLTLFLLAYRLHESASVLRFLQVLALPIAFPYSFLVYTDMIAAWLVASSLILALQYRSGAGSLTLSGAVLLRQQNICWAPVLLYQAYISRSKSRLSWWLPSVAPLAALLLVVALGGGLAASRTGLHPLGIYAENTHLLMLAVGAICLPLVSFNASSIWKPLRANWIYLAVAILLMGSFLLSFGAQHPFNWGMHEYFPRNRLLAYLQESWLNRLTVIPIYAAGVTFLLNFIAADRIRNTLVVICGIAILLPSLLIEHRYYIQFIMIVTLLRTARPLGIELASLAWSATLSAVVLTRFISGEGLL